MAAKPTRKTTVRSKNRRTKSRWLVASRRWLPLAGLAAAVIVAGGVGYLFGTQGGRSPSRPQTTVAVAPIKPPLPTAAPGQPGPTPPTPVAAPGQPVPIPPLPNAAPGEAVNVAPPMLTAPNPTSPIPASPVPASPVPVSPVPAPQGSMPSLAIPPVPPAPDAGSYADRDRRRLAELAREAAAEPPRSQREVAALPPTAVVPPKVPHGRRPSLALAPNERPMIAMVFDDLGVVKSRTKRVIDLPGPLTLSFLPYAQDLPAQTADGRRHGHEIILHMPMQPLGKADPGPRALTVDLTPEEIRERLTSALDRVGTVGGLNNHMGSRFTGNMQGMGVVMGVLQRRQLYFLDSMTIGSSVGVAAARQAGVPAVARDVFLDDKVTRENAVRWLAALENVAKRQGYGIAIGHPHDETVDVVGPWLATLESKGLRLVRLGELVRRLNPAREDTPVSASVRAPG